MVVDVNSSSMIITIHIVNNTIQEVIKGIIKITTALDTTTIGVVETTARNTKIQGIKMKTTMIFMGRKSPIVVTRIFNRPMTNNTPRGKLEVRHPKKLV